MPAGMWDKPFLFVFVCMLICLIDLISLQLSTNVIQTRARITACVSINWTNIHVLARKDSWALIVILVSLPGQYT